MGHQNATVAQVQPAFSFHHIHYPPTRFTRCRGPPNGSTSLRELQGWGIVSLCTYWAEPHPQSKSDGKFPTAEERRSVGIIRLACAQFPFGGLKSDRGGTQPSTS